MTEKQTKTPSEAQGIAFLQLYGTEKDEDGVEHTISVNVTERSDYSSKSALAGIMDTIQFAKEEYGMTPYKVSNPAPTPAPASAPSAPAQPEYVSAEEEAGYIIATRMQVEPQGTGRSTILFFEEGCQRPSLRIPNWEYPAILRKLWEVGKFTIEHIDHAVDYNTNWIVHYELSSKLNNNGVPYKDVTRITPNTLDN